MKRSCKNHFCLWKTEKYEKFNKNLTNSHMLEILCEKPYKWRKNSMNIEEFCNNFAIYKFLNLGLLKVKNYLETSQFCEISTNHTLKHSFFKIWRKILLSFFCFFTTMINSYLHHLSSFPSLKTTRVSHGIQ